MHPKFLDRSRHYATERTAVGLSTIIAQVFVIVNASWEVSKKLSSRLTQVIESLGANDELLGFGVTQCVLLFIDFCIDR